MAQQHPPCRGAQLRRRQPARGRERPAAAARRRRLHPPTRPRDRPRRLARAPARRAQRARHRLPDESAARLVLGARARARGRARRQGPGRAHRRHPARHHRAASGRGRSAPAQRRLRQHPRADADVRSRGPPARLQPGLSRPAGPAGAGHRRHAARAGADRWRADGPAAGAGHGGLARDAGAAPRQRLAGAGRARRGTGLRAERWPTAAGGVDGRSEPPTQRAGARAACGAAGRPDRPGQPRPFRESAEAADGAQRGRAPGPAVDQPRRLPRDQRSARPRRGRCLPLRGRAAAAGPARRARRAGAHFRR